MLKVISKIFGGTKSEKDIKQIKPIVTEINNIYEKLHSISDEELKGKTEYFREKTAFDLLGFHCRYGRNLRKNRQ